MFKHKTLRNNELMLNWRASLRHTFESADALTRTGVIDNMLEGSRPRYDVSYEYAVRVMYRMIRDGLPCPARGPMKRQMWEEISRHVRRTMELHHCPIPEAVARVLAEQKASRYFLSRKQASKIIYHERNNRRNRHSAV